MKFVFTSVFVLFIASAFSQSLTSPATFTLYEHSACDSSYKLANYFTLHGNSVALFPDTLGVIKVYKAGEYSLRHSSSELPYWGKKFQIQGSITDTVEIAPIHLVGMSQGIGPTYYRYYNCGQICNGKLTSFWVDGTIRQEGRFKDGHIKIYKSYYSSGSIKRKIKNGLLIDYLYQYDESGKLLVKQKFILFCSRSVFYNEESNKYLKGTHFGHY